MEFLINFSMFLTTKSLNYIEPVLLLKVRSDLGVFPSQSLILSLSKILLFSAYP